MHNCKVMLLYFVSYHIVLYSTVLYCIIMYSIVLYCIVLYCVMLGLKKSCHRWPKESGAVVEVRNCPIRQRMVRLQLQRPTRPALPGHYLEATMLLAAASPCHHNYIQITYLSAKSWWQWRWKCQVYTFTSQLLWDRQREHLPLSLPPRNLGLYVPQMLHIIGHSKVTNAC